MADMLGTGLSSLRALQRALDTTAHNIANVSTPGYSRQRVEFETRTPSMSGSQLDRQRRRREPGAPHLRPVPDRADAATASGNLARLEAFATQAERLDNMLGDTTNGLSASLQAYTDALSEVSSTPGSIPARQVLLSEGRALAQRIARLRRPPARNVGRHRYALRGRSARSLADRAGHRAAQRRNHHRHRRTRASRRTICSISATASSTKSRARSASRR